MSNALREWSELSSKRTSLMTRLEKYAGYTLPALLPPDGFDPMTTELSFDWQSVGAQCLNHLSNKMVLTLFAPSRPFLRLEADPKWLAKVTQTTMAGAPAITEQEVIDALAEGERKATRGLDQTPGFRPMLYVLLQNLIALGNVVLHLPVDDSPVRLYNIRNYCVRRTGTGEVKTLLIRQCLQFDELDPKVQDAVKAHKGGMRFNKDTKVKLFQMIERDIDGSYELTQWVDDIRLPDEFSGTYKNYEELPYRVLTWKILPEAHYGTGLVEDYAGDFAALSALSEAQVKAAVLASEFRWLVRPNGMTSPEDLENSENGDVIPGSPEDINIVDSKKSQDIVAIQGVNAEYVTRIGRGFLLGSAITRQAERVTAEEIRMQATELETSLGGAYSRIALEVQAPVGRWLLAKQKMNLRNTQIVMTIVTGLDALSRSGDLDALRGALADLAGIGTLSPEMRATLKLSEVSSTIFNGHGLDKAKFVRSEEEVAAMQQQAQEAAITNQATEAAAQASAQATANPQ